MPKALDLINQKYGKLTVIQKAPNKNKRTAWLCKCDCGNEIIVTTQALRSGNVKSCGCLYHKDLIGKKFGQLLVLKATNKRRHGSVVWECLCDCGNITYATTEGLRTGDNVSCGCRNKGSETFAERQKVNLTGQKFGKLTVIGATDMRTNSGNQVWKCLCDCGNICYVSTNHLQSHNTQSCGCLQGNSIGELEIKQILDDLNINYQQEYIFAELPNRRYDFAVFNNQQEIIELIEFDGEQHYMETPYFHTTLLEQQQIDYEKTQFAKSKDIPLIRIPYWKRGNITKEDILLWETLIQING